MPTLEEVLKALRKFKFGKASGTDRITTDHLKVLAETLSGRLLILQIVRTFWVGDDVEPDWLISRLRLIPKAGDKTDPNKWRGISLLQQCNKLVSSVISARLQQHLGLHGLETQSGFTAGRGTTDGFFLLQQALALRKERKLDTWMLAIDLVKAFDRVDRRMLWRVLAKFGVPKHMIRMIKRLYDNSTLQLQFDGAKVGPITSTTGVKQGDNLAPVLFLYVFQAAFETIEWPDECTPLQFNTTNSDGVLINRNLDRSTKGQTLFRGGVRDRYEEPMVFGMRESLYADDCGLLFDSWDAWCKGTEAVRNGLARFGLEMHIAKPGDELEGSKTVGVHFPAIPEAAVEQEIGRLGEFTVGERVYSKGRIPWVSTFKYLGSVLSSDLSETPNTKARIKAATKAFGAMSKILCDRNIRLEVRSKLYTLLVLPVLLYGSECWHVKSESLLLLQSFHRSCCRRIAKVTRWKQWKQKVTSQQILEMLGVYKIDYYVTRGFMRWLGHISRMSDERLPKRLLFGWVHDDYRGYTRGLGRPRETFNRKADANIIMLYRCQNAEMKQLFHQSARSKWNGVGNNLPFYACSLQDWQREVTWRVGYNKELHEMQCWSQFSEWRTVAADRTLWRKCVYNMLEHLK